MTDIDEQSEALLTSKGRRESGGGFVGGDSAGSPDPLFRKFMMWTWGFFGVVFMGMQLWLVSSVADIKSTLLRLTDKDTQIDAHLLSTDRRVEKLEDRYDTLRSRVDQIDGRGLRGGPEGKEPHRGN